MAITTGTVIGIENRMVLTKFGNKPTYTINLDTGEKINAGFKAPPCSAGDNITVEYGGRYSQMEHLKVNSSVPSHSVSRSAGASVIVAPTPMDRVQFPIPALAKERSIVRQNALTHANTAMINRLNSTKDAWSKVDNDEYADSVIRMARRFEAYSAGDIERIAVENRSEEKDANE